MKRAFPFLIALLAISLSSYLWAQENESLETKEIRQLVKKLESEEYQAREDASQALEKIGEPALPFLEKALKSIDPEVVWRSQKIIRKIRRQEEQNSKSQVQEENQKKNLDRQWELKGPGFQLKFSLRGNLNQIPEWKEIQKMIEKVEQQGRLDPRTFESQMKKWQQEWQKEVKNVFPPEKEILKLLESFQENWPEQEKVWQEKFEKLFSENFPNPQDWQRQLEKGRKLEQLIERFISPLPEKQFEKEKEKLLSRYGIQVREVDPVVQENFQLFPNEGVIVEEVQANKIFAKAKVQPWDLLLKINRHTIEGIPSLEEILDNLEPNQEHLLTIIRGGKREELRFQK